MKKIYLLLAAAMATVSLYGETTIYGFRNYQANDGLSVKGPVKISATDPSKVTLIADQSSLGSVYAGTYFNYKWYAQVTKAGTNSTLDGLYTIDMETGERTLISTKGTYLTEMAYDYTTSTTYGIRTGAEQLMTIDLTTGETTSVGYFAAGVEYPYMLALSVDMNGVMYGIATDDNLYTIDKTNAQCTLVGELGVNAGYTQSMDFDRNTGVLYWINSATHGLYTVDTTTGAATFIGFVGEDGVDSVQSMFVPYIDVAAGAPDRVLNRRAEANGNNITLTWTNPSVDAQGNALTELTSVKIYRDKELIATVSVTADKIGQTMTYSDAGVSEGLHLYTFAPVNSKGEGGVDTDDLEMYVGDNAPGAVGSFKATAGDGNATLTWTKPTTGKYGGSFDPSSITKYVITRWSGSAGTDIEVSDASATSYVDAPTTYGKYTYSIYAVNGVGDGAKATSEEVMVKPDNWIIMTNGEAVVENGKTYTFYDEAGPNAVYANSLNDKLTIRPADPNSLIHVEFKTFETDGYDDWLYIYNGSTADDEALIGSYCAEDMPAALKSVESTATDGALTFVFQSDVMDRREGWEAEVTAVEKKQHDLVAGTLSGELYPLLNGEETYTLPVTNKGVEAVTSADYKVKLVDADGKVYAETAGIAASSMETVTVSATITFAEKKDIQLHAEVEYASDEDTSNNSSNTLAISVVGADGQFATVGENDEAIYVVPFSFSGDESLSESLYFSNEIDVKSGTLKMIQYQLADADETIVDVPVKIWVAETELQDLSETSVGSDQMTLVYDGKMTFNAGAETVTFQLQNPYEYKGGNLLVLVYKKSVGFTTYGVTFKGTYGYDSTVARSRFDSTFDSSEGEMDTTATPLGYVGSTIYANTTFLFTNVGDGGVNSVKTSNVAVYPNPTSDVINISGIDVARAELYNAAGQKVASTAASTLNIQGAAAGIYYLRITSADGNVQTVKVVKK